MPEAGFTLLFTDVEAVAARARRDMARGEPWLAADRLQSALAVDPHAAELREPLAAAHLALGQVRAAGRVLAFTERTDPQVVDATDVWLASFGDPERLSRRAVRELAVTGLLDDDPISLGPVATARLSRYEQGARAARIYRGEGRELRVVDRSLPSTWRTKFESAALLVLLVGAGAGGATLFIAGLVQIGQWWGLW